MRATILLVWMLLICGVSPSRGAPAATQPASPATAPATTTIGATRAAATRPADDPLATPDSAVLHLFELMRRNRVSDVRAMLIDPPPPEQLKERVAIVARRLSKGVKFELVETKVEKSAAVVMYRTIYPSGRTEVTPIILVERYDRWKALLGTLNPKRYTQAEKEDLVVANRWAQERLPELNPPATQAATRPAP
jgi:hypothetical protein